MTANETPATPPAQSQEKELTVNGHREAPASFNVKAVSPEGYDIMLTLRDDQSAELMKRALLALEWLKVSGFQATGRPAAPAILAPSPSPSPAPSPAPPQLANAAPVPNAPNGPNAAPAAP